MTLSSLLRLFIGLFWWTLHTPLSWTTVINNIEQNWDADILKLLNNCYLPSFKLINIALNWFSIILTVTISIFYHFNILWNYFYHFMNHKWLTDGWLSSLDWLEKKVPVHLLLIMLTQNEDHQFDKLTSLVWFRIKIQTLKASKPKFRLNFKSPTRC